MARSEPKQQQATQNTKKKEKSLRSHQNDSEEVSLSDLKNLKSDIKKEYKRSLKSRYKFIGKYKSDRWIWQGAMLLIFFWLWFVAQSYNYSLDYYKCGDGERLYEGPHQVCKNPFYKAEDSWKSQEYLPYGEYGQKLGPLFHTAGYVAFGVLFLAGVLNHLIHNRGFKK